jgi:hypothetical protein
MTKAIVASMGFALLCAGSMAASAAISHEYSDRIVRHTNHLVHQKIAAMRAAVPERPTVFPSAWPRAYPYNFHETDGLSRNPNDCAVWGCIDSN